MAIWSLDSAHVVFSCPVSALAATLLIEPGEEVYPGEIEGVRSRPPSFRREHYEIAAKTSVSFGPVVFGFT